MRAAGAITGTLTACLIGAASAVLPASPMPARHPAIPPASALARSAPRIFPMLRYGHPAPSAARAGGYTPAQIRAAYYVNPLLGLGINGTGQTIVIVDSFGSPTIQHDLSVFDRAFGLPDPPALQIIAPAGKIPRFSAANSSMVGWAWETTLDVEWAHVMAPRAKIVLAETPVSESEGTTGFPQIQAAEQYVIAHHLGGVISQSFGATEQTFPSPSAIRALRRAYTDAAKPANNITVVSASGDAGATDYQNNGTSLYTYPVTSWPASDPLVTAVGGTEVQLNGSGNRIAPDQVWNDGSALASGGGQSTVFSRPAYQAGITAISGNRRGVPDLAMSAACASHSVDVFASFMSKGGGWSAICGTSEATPLLAGVITLVGQVVGHPVGLINPYLYQMAAARDKGIVDITRGSNTVGFAQGGKNFTVQGWAAVPGYDLASGLGTINAHWFVLDLAARIKAHH